MRSDGYVKVSDLLTRPKLRNLGCDFDRLQRIVATNDKQRFTLTFEPADSQDGQPSCTDVIVEPQEDSDGTWWIRANQGHSIEVEDLQVKEVASAEEIPVVIHGTNMRAWQSIKREGLSKMNRNHIHMAKGLSSDKSVISGMHEGRSRLRGCSHIDDVRLRHA